MNEKYLERIFEDIFKSSSSNRYFLACFIYINRAALKCTSRMCKDEKQIRPSVQYDNIYKLSLKLITVQQCKLHLFSWEFLGQRYAGMLQFVEQSSV